MRDAAGQVLSQIRKMKDAQILDEYGKKISVDELPNFVNLQELRELSRVGWESLTPTRTHWRSACKSGEFGVLTMILLCHVVGRAQ